MSKVLLVDTNLAALPILQSLQAANHEVHVVGVNPQDTLAQLQPDQYIKIDYANWQELKREFLLGKFDTLIPGCNDVSYESCSQVSRELGLPGYASPEVNTQLSQKASFRTLASRLGLPTPRAISLNAATRSNGLVIVKPVDAFSGRGVSVIHSKNSSALLSACHRAKQASRTEQFLIEEYVSGQLFSHSAFLMNKRIIQDVFVQEHCNAYPFAVDTSWVDHDVPTRVRASVRDSVERLARWLDLRDGLLHTQFIANSAEEALIIEPTLRCPGDLYSRLVELSLDTPYAENYWRPFLELPPIITKEKAGSHVVRHTVTFDYSGRFQGLQLSKPLAVKEFYPLMRVGEQHSSAPTGRAGVLFLQFPTAEAQAGACESLLDRSALKYPTLEAEAEEGVAECAS